MGEAWRNGTYRPRRQERKGCPVGALPFPWPCPRAGCVAEPHSESGFRSHLRKVHSEASPRAVSLALDRFRRQGGAA